MTAAPKPLNIALQPLDNARLQNLCGALDENLRQIEAAFDVTISRRGQNCRIGGDPAQSRLAGAALQHFYEQAGEPLSIDEIQLGLIEISATAMLIRRTRGAAECRPDDAQDRPARPHAEPGASTCARSRNTTSPSASARPAPARPTSRSPRRSTPSSATRSAASC
jgi:hypothetical protein